MTMKERIIAQSQIVNWAANDGGQHPPENESRLIKVVQGRGYGGISFLSDEVWGEAEIHVELDDRGLHLLVYVPGDPQGDPVLNAFVRRDGLLVEEVGLKIAKGG